MTWKILEDIPKLIISKHVFFFFVNSEEKVHHYFSLSCNVALDSWKRITE